jgi:AraC-like DNA-binding protein
MIANVGKATGILLAAARVRSWSPGVALAPFVEEYSLREDRLGAVEIYNPLPARSDCFLQFYLEDTYRVVTVASGAVHAAPRCVLVGPHTRRREDLIWTGHLKMFTIRFSAVGFRALFGVQAQVICNFAGSAELVLGAAVREIEERLRGVCEEALGAVAEQCLLRQLAKVRVAADGGVALRMVRSMRARGGGFAVSDLAERYGLSVRQVERGFQEHVGLSPKVFARLTRLRAAMKLSEQSELAWAEIAAAAGYFDQSHMVREFRDLNGATPAAFAELGRRAKEYRNTGWDVAFVLSGVGAGLVA